ncbi:uncharacterized protein LOC127588823 [Hippocampus zosterae]|uniref:uncharacterized protein LOC127588823 n=1 Tax=Hippocampus zosterae TaxID=109293 RepID=UPI00223CB17E|nr:uncharacterized protein LOC127588823 [Hippocampus zosterae]
MQGCGEEDSGTASNLAGEEEGGRFEMFSEPDEAEDGRAGGRVQGEGCDGETEVSDLESSQDDSAEGPPPTDFELTPAVLSSQTSNTIDGPSESCWYCLRSLDPEYHPGASQDSDSLSLPPSGGQTMNYQKDPRPHFGVACSSHAPCRPLWGSEGPNWVPRGTPDGVDDELQQQTQRACPHCHLAMPADTLSWHETKCLQFDGLRKLDK